MSSEWGNWSSVMMVVKHEVVMLLFIKNFTVRHPSPSGEGPGMRLPWHLKTAIKKLPLYPLRLCPYASLRVNYYAVAENKSASAGKNRNTITFSQLSKGCLRFSSTNSFTIKLLWKSLCE